MRKDALVQQPMAILQTHKMVLPGQSWNYWGERTRTQITSHPFWTECYVQKSDDSPPGTHIHFCTLVGGIWEKFANCGNTNGDPAELQYASNLSFFHLGPIGWLGTSFSG